MAEWLGENNTIAQSSVLTITVLQGAFRQSGVPNIAHYDLPRLPTVAWPAQSVILSVCLYACLLSYHLSRLVVRIAQILILVPPPPFRFLPHAAGAPTPVIHGPSFPELLLPQSWSLSGFGCNSAVPVSQSWSISNPVDCISLTPSPSRRPNPRLLSPMRQS